MVSSSRQHLDTHTHTHTHTHTRMLHLFAYMNGLAWHTAVRWLSCVMPLSRFSVLTLLTLL